MKKFVSLFMMANLIFAVEMYAQKGKITSAQLYLQDGKVMEAKKEIDAAFQNPEALTMIKAWSTKGDIYKNIYESKIYYAQNPKCLFDAKEAYLKAFELETNSKKQKEYGTPLNMVASYLFNEGLERFNSKKHDDAYAHFEASRSANEFLFSKGLVSSIDTNTIYATTMAGMNANKLAEVKPLLEKLVDMNYNNAVVYESLADIYENEGNKAALQNIVSKGLKRFPNNKNLQIVELNQTLDNGDANAAIEKFEKAVLSEPKNSSMWFNLGVLYDKAQNEPKARDAYEKAIAIKPDYGDAYFNLGVMYFNQGVSKNKEMNNVDETKDRDGSIYNGLKKQRDEIFAKALPYLEKAHQIDPKNVAYKTNLKKVYASMNMLDKAKSLSEE